jgi:hypothetical protein
MITCDWSSDVCSSDLRAEDGGGDEGGGNGALFCVLTFVSTEEGGGECQPAGTRVKQSTII